MAVAAQDAARQLREALAALQRDVAASFRLCGRDFGVLGRELVAALQQRQRLEHAVLEQERGRRRRLQRQLTEAQGGALRVLCRVRPPLPRRDVESHALEAAPDADSSPKLKHLRVHVSSEDAEVRVSSALDGALVKSFRFQRVLGEESTQELVFRDVAPLVAAALDGRRACVFAYGQVGAGKTHSMQGMDGDRGVYFRAAHMARAAAQAQAPQFAFTLSLQLVEIYNEEVFDLLAPGAGSAAAAQQQQQQQAAQFFSPPTTASTSSALSASSARAAVEIRHGESGVYLKNVTTVAMDDEDAVHAAILRAAANRAVFATAKNEQSSRSHCVLLIDVERQSRQSGEVTTGRLAIVDLAGSERLSRTTTTGHRLREAQYINKSLCAISDVMSALLAKEKHIPFRNSKLTHMLQDSLGGDNLALLLVHVSPESADVSETIDTLKFASRVTSVKVRGAARSEISRLNAVITSQSSQLQAMQEKLTAELELRKKYEKRLEEYRQEENRRKAREDELKKQHALAPLASSSMLSPEQQIAARRWSLYSRKDSIALKSANNARGLNGLENISENILRSRSAVVLLPEETSSTFNHASTPVREKRRQSVYKANLTPGAAEEEASQLGKRANPSASEVKSILKKQRVELPQHHESSTPSTSSAAQQAKQVSFRFSPRTPSPASQSSLPPPRQPGQLLRTTPAAARVPAAGRVRAPVSSFASSPVRRVVASTPARPKPKPNVGWR